MISKNTVTRIFILIGICLLSFYGGYKFATIPLKSFYEGYKVATMQLKSNLPDLIVTDITQEGRYIYVHYMNQGLVGGEGDFLIKISALGKSFEGNRYYRFKIPAPGQIRKTGGFTLGLIGLKKGMEKIVTAEIDWEKRIDERNENNNVFHKQVRID